MSGTPENNNAMDEEELRRRLEIVKDLLENGKLKFGDAPTVIESLKQVRYGEDGKVDLTTVDSIVRSVANAVAMMEDRRQMKDAISLSDIQGRYFEYIQTQFGWLYEDMLKHSATPHQMASLLSTKEEFYSQTDGNHLEFMDAITEFWMNAGEIAYAHVEDSLDGLKGVFGGDMFPTSSESIVSNVGLYLDTVIVPDPFLRARLAMEAGDVRRRTYYLVKHGLNLLRYRDVALADINPPLLVVLPDITALYPEEREFVMQFSEPDVLAHARRIFGQQFATVEDMFSYAEALNTIDKVVKSIRDPTRVVFDVEEDIPIEERISRATESEVAGIMGTNHPGITVASIAPARLGTVNELLLKARRLRGTPLIDAPTSWQFYKWKLEYDAGRAFTDQEEGHGSIVRGLQSLATGDMEWMGRIPHDALIDIRQQGAMDEIRMIISRGINEVGSTSDIDIDATADRVAANIEEAFRSHRDRLSEIKGRKWRFAGHDIGSWLVTGTIEVAAVATGSPYFGVAGIVAHQLMNAPKLSELPKKYKEILQDESRVRNSPVGLLFKHKD